LTGAVVVSALQRHSLRDKPATQRPAQRRRKVFVEESLAKDEEIAFNAGSHSELVRLSYKDFERLVRPTAAKFSLRQ
jgi:prolyl-tRNA editing enzyme YbaK/EbsC (Cys-tRNA(Pro) deacylase)